MKKKLLSAAIAVGLFSFAVAGQAATVPLSGSFNTGTDVFTGWFTVDNSVDPSGVVLATTSFAANGFDPFLAVWSDTGSLLWKPSFSPAGNDDFYSAVATSGANLANGTYYFTITNWPNTPVSTSLSDGFAGGISTSVIPAGRSGNWSITVSGVLDAGALPIPTPPTPAVPEPETWAMLLAGLGIVGAVARRRSAK